MKASLVRPTSHRLAQELCWYCRCAALKLNIKLNEISNRTSLSFPALSTLPAFLFCVADDILCCKTVFVEKGHGGERYKKEVFERERFKNGEGGNVSILLILTPFPENSPRSQKTDFVEILLGQFSRCFLCLCKSRCVLRMCQGRCWLMIFGDGKENVSRILMDAYYRCFEAGR